MQYNTKLFDILIKVNEKKILLEKKLENENISFEKATKIRKQMKPMNKVSSLFSKYKSLIQDYELAEKIIIDKNSEQDMIDFAKEEINHYKVQIPLIEEEVTIALLPTDPNNDKNVIIEMRPAVGGDEAAIFVLNLFEAYKRFSEIQNWKLTIIDLKNQAHGYDYVSFSISGTGVYSKMKFESGVHRVQRVPATESKGRVHTSTITVAVLPEQDELDIKIVKSDLREDTYRAGGAGGQHVNRTESAVRITHLPTGIVAACQDGKSQHSNRDTAMKMLRSKIWEYENNKRNLELSTKRKKQVGTGERSEKIRTYNYPQNRVSDHRISLTLNKLDQIMNSGILHEIIDPLIADEQSKLMLSIGSMYDDE